MPLYALISYYKIVQLSMTDWTKVIGSLIFCYKMDKTDDSLKNLADRISYHVIDELKKDAKDEEKVK